MAYDHGRRVAMTPLANFHLPLPPDLREMLHEEAERSGQPATAVAREALHSWLTQRRKQRLHDDIAEWATEHAGTALDLDKDLEQAGLDALAAGSS
jgi:predicted transcriptional regulator